MEREKIKIEEDMFQSLIGEDRGYIGGYQYNKNPDFLTIEKIITYTDLSKGYTNYDIIIQRVEDGKFFIGEYCETSQEWRIDDLQLKEVFKTPILTPSFIYT
jgi:hypothetical protein